MNRREVALFKEKEFGGITPQAFANAIRASEGLVGSLCFERKLAAGSSSQVYTLCFNTDGTKLLSGSHELYVWDWEAGSGEQRTRPRDMAFISNAQFMPHSNNSIILCGDLGKVMHVQLLGERNTGKKLVDDDELGYVPKMAIDLKHPDTFYACSTSGNLLHFDLRTKEYRKTQPIVDSDGDSVSLYDIAIDPINPDFIAVAGEMKATHIYDIRKLVGSKSALSNSMVCSVFPTKSSPRSCRARVNAEHVIALAYSKTGELLMSYWEDDMYLLPRGQVTSSNYEIGEEIVYKGHKNSKCRSSVCFLGPNSEYVTSGCDTGNTIIWRKKDGEPLRALSVDTCWVQCIAPHPIDPSLATSGESQNINVWAPKSFDSQRTTEEDNNLHRLKEENTEEYRKEKAKEMKKVFLQSCALHDKMVKVGRLSAEEEQTQEQLTQLLDEWDGDFEETESDDEKASEEVELLDKIFDLIEKKMTVGLTDEERQQLEQINEVLVNASEESGGGDALDEELPGNN